MGETGIKKFKSDTVIIGSGLGGLYSALNIESNYKVTILSKTSEKESNSALAQGGIAVSFHKETHYTDTIRAGANYNSEEAVKVLVEDSVKNIEKLINYGIGFDKDELGNFKLTCEGGHTKNNVLYSKDSTGKEIIDSLIKQVELRKNVLVKDKVFAIDILIENNKVMGVLAINELGEKEIYFTETVVIATGGVGHIYKTSTNSSFATGDGIAMAYRAGAEIIDMEFVQFHPTALYDETTGQKFLISEAVRGEGGILKNIYGDPFMKKYNPMGDLAPRDIVSQSIFKEMLMSNSSFVYLDISHKSPEFIKYRFPMIYNTCIERGYDITKEKIPVVPAEHYLMGGIKTDIQGRTNIDGLYACGECACTGVHGANRLASNSLLECIVYGNRVSRSINKYLNSNGNSYRLDEEEVNYKFDDNPTWNPNEIQNVIKEIMNNYVSVIRTYQGLEEAYIELLEIKNTIINTDEYIRSVKHIETENMLTVALLITRAALERKMSIGAHFLVG